MDKQILFLKTLLESDARKGSWESLWDVKNVPYWQKRICNELLYVAKFSHELMQKKYDSKVKSSIDKLKKYYDQHGVVTKEITYEIEKDLSEVQKEIKKYSIIFVAHAHIDMNWQWGTAETTALTLGTFRTMLDLMNEYEDFIFSQSQASTYEIVEKYDPEMLKEIQARVKEGRWEVIASTWVEPDKNMPNGESMSRHILYTKKYMKELFGVNEEDNVIDFEPDTFGHNANIPEILTNGGVKYYYHCRGYDGHIVYRMKAKSGKEIICFREPSWYLGAVNDEFICEKVDFYRITNVKTSLEVYGVGNHGGGPTRRDIENIIDMRSWPLLPTIKFGTYKEFFESLEEHRDTFPIVDHELNFIFDGCYTSQSRITAANRIGENRLYQSEFLSSFASVYKNFTYEQDYFATGWKNILFNQFHDILPGSGVVDTREAAMGMFQDTLSRANTAMTNAISEITKDIDTTNLVPDEDISATTSEGAGTGIFVTDFFVPADERGTGSGRIYHFFNNTAFPKKEVVNIKVWDYPSNIDDVVLKDAKGKIVNHQLLKKERLWGHVCDNILVEVEVPAFGYSTYILVYSPTSLLEVKNPPDPRAIKLPEYKLENDHVSIEFDPISLDIISFKSKKGGKELVNYGNFRFVKEDHSGGGTAWVVGRYKDTTEIKDIKIIEFVLGPDKLQQYVKYSGVVSNSKIVVTLVLDRNKSSLDYFVEVDWFEKGTHATYIPQLQYKLDLNYEAKNYLYDIPYGVINRESLYHDVPALSFICGENKNDNSIQIITKTKYGYRGYKNSLFVDLIRSSCDPDPYPEVGVHKIEFSVGVTGNVSPTALQRNSVEYNYPALYTSGRVHKGSAPLSNTFIDYKSNAFVSAVKMSESNNKTMIFRLAEIDGKDEKVSIKFEKAVKKAYFVDTNEIKTSGKVDVNKNSISFSIKHDSICNVAVEF